MHICQILRQGRRKFLKDKLKAERCTVTLFRDFFAPFCCGENNGDRAFFQTKRAQQVPCMPLIVMCIVLRREVYYTTQLTSKIVRIERSTEQDSSTPFRGTVRSCFGFQAFFFTIFHVRHCWATSSFCLHLLDQFSMLHFVRENGDFASTDTSTSIDCKASNLKTKSAANACTHWPAPWPRVSSSPFLTAKNLHKNTE